VEFITANNGCYAPAAVDIDEIFDMQVTYKLTTIERRDPDGLLEHFPNIPYDGGYYYDYLIGLSPFRSWWVWFFWRFFLNFKKGASDYAVVQTNYKSTVGQPLVWTFHGKITDLVPAAQPGQSIDLKWQITAQASGAHNPEDGAIFPTWGPTCSFNEICDGSLTLPWTIKVNSLPTNHLALFDLAYCEPSCGVVGTVAPDETFNINIRIVNQNACPSDSFTIKSVCMGHTKTLGTGSIGAAGTPGGTVDRSYPVTAQDLAGKTFTEDSYLDPTTIQVYNGAGQLTDSWPWPAQPYTVAVLVGGGGGGTGNLTGIVKDNTGAPLAGVSVTCTGGSAVTNETGDYAIYSLPVKSYSVKFSRSGYGDVTKTAYIYDGQDTTLNVAMTAGGGGATEIPWKWIAIGAGGLVGVILVAKGLKGG
jgi:hypothetical protein